MDFSLIKRNLILAVLASLFTYFVIPYAWADELFTISVFIGVFLFMSMLALVYQATGFDKKMMSKKRN